MGKFTTYETAWCPGCGNFAILNSLKKALEELDKDPKEVLMVAGIGQAAKTPQYISANSFCGLHGRALPAAVAAKIANEKLTVIVDSGDGDSYGEGGNHFIHNIRRNVNITHFVHDNQIYGLTKGQASPTSKEGHVTEVQTNGNINTPLNPVLMAIAAGAGFVARGFSGDAAQLVTLMKEAILYPGYAFVDILQPCISFNKINTFAYYKSKGHYDGDGRGKDSDGYSLPGG
jgi:2-oxoglutarate ferredoxin oxidoreductase subunit beta